MAVVPPIGATAISIFAKWLGPLLYYKQCNFVGPVGYQPQARPLRLLRLQCKRLQIRQWCVVSGVIEPMLLSKYNLWLLQYFRAGHLRHDVPGLDVWS